MAEQGLALGCATKVAGFSLHAGVMMSNAQDRSKLERLCRYITRSGVSEKRLAIEPGALVLFRGRNSIHRVTPTQGETNRMLAVLAYNSQPGIALSEAASKTFYGRVN